MTSHTESSDLICSPRSSAALRGESFTRAEDTDQHATSWNCGVSAEQTKRESLLLEEALARFIRDFLLRPRDDVHE